MLLWFKANRFLWISLVTATLFYATISLVNHYCFRTYSLDLGAYTNALYDYSHFRWNDSTAFKEMGENLLADHFDLYLVIFSPLIYIFGTYSLLVVQILAILFGAFGFFRLINLWFPEKPLIGKIGLIYFLCFFPIFSALSFDYHSNVVAAMLIPWFILMLEKEKLKSAFIIFFLVVIAKENMSLWLCFINAGLVWKYWQRKNLRRTSFLMMGFSIFYFILVTSVLMPNLSSTGTFGTFKYSLLGETASEALLFILQHPLQAISYLFVNTSGNPLYDFVKMELWVFIFINGFILFRKPYYLLMLVPIVGQKLFSDNPLSWGVTHHYCIEFVPIITIGTFDVIRSISFPKLQKTLAFSMLFIGLATSIHVMDNTIAFAEKARIRIYKKAHYEREFPIGEAYKVLKMIPGDAVVSAQSAFVPHLSLRDKIYTFPIIKDAEYVLFSPLDSCFPLTDEQYKHKMDSLSENLKWKEIYKTRSFVLLKSMK